MFILFLLKFLHTRPTISGQLSSDEIKNLTDIKDVKYSPFTETEREEMAEQLKKEDITITDENNNEQIPFSYVTDSDVKLRVNNKELINVLDTLSGREQTVSDLGIFEEVIEQLNKESEKEFSLIDMIRNGNTSFFLIFTHELSNKDCANLRLLKEKNIPYFISSSREMAKKMNVEYPGTLAYNHSDRVFYRMGELNVGTALTPLFSILSTDVVKFIDLSKLPPFYVFISHENWNVPEKGKNLEQDIRALARTKKDQFKFTMIKYVNGQTDLTHFGIEQEDLPAMVHLNLNRQKYVLKDIKAIEQLSEFIDKFEKNEIKPFTRSAEIIDNTEMDLKQIVAKNHKEFLTENHKKDVLLVYGSARCPHCVRLLPILESLSQNIKNHKDAVVAYIDLESNDVDVVIEAFPTIILYPSTDEFSLEKGIKFPDYSRTENALKRFIKEKGNVNKDIHVEEEEVEEVPEEDVEQPDVREMREVKEEL